MEWFLQNIWPTLQPLLVTLIAGVIAESMKKGSKLVASPKRQEQLKSVLPLISGLIGGVAAAVMADPAYQDVAHQITTGTMGGFAATGLHQSYRQLKK